MTGATAYWLLLSGAEGPTSSLLIHLLRMCRLPAERSSWGENPQLPTIHWIINKAHSSLDWRCLHLLCSSSLPASSLSGVFSIVCCTVSLLLTP
ncbi:hypothetical protein Q7C36_013654 [Tachysurus vachellii]|uniref:Uncharacterized protein n=1 Tax=Tachysurus vachellii TaxID=175792 RepID=A0AA88MID3_TACVA|nr:hypothetical protein Q7C36_013654 [Tachysurus vachellii]